MEMDEAFTSPYIMGLVDTMDSTLCLRDRIVVLDDDIEPCSAGRLTRMFQLLSTKPDPTALELEPITLLISSNGGDLNSGAAIIRAIRSAQMLGCEIYGEVRGYCMSMAAIILQQCTMRYAAPDDIVMIHGPTGQNIGDIRNQEADLKLTGEIMKQWSIFLADRNTSEDSVYHEENHWRKLLNDNFPHYFFGREAFAAGLIDEVIN